MPAGSKGSCPSRRAPIARPGRLSARGSAPAGGQPLHARELRKAGWSYVLLTVRFRTNEISTVRVVYEAHSTVSDAARHNTDLACASRLSLPKATAPSCVVARML